MRGRAVATLLAFVLGSAPSTLRVARAGDPAGPERLEVRIVPVESLTRGRIEFIPNDAAFPGERVADEAKPLFGGEGEEPTLFYGTIEDLVELTKMQFAPRAWEREGFSIEARGPRELVLRATREVLDEVEAYVGRLEAEALATVAIDAVALVGSPDAASGAGGLSGAVSRGDLRVLASVRTSALPGQRVSAFAGIERSYVDHEEVEVAKEAAVTAPGVDVLQEGLHLDARPTLSSGRIRLETHPWLVRIASLDRRVTALGDAFEVPTWDVHQSAAPSLGLRAGEWSLLPSSGNVVFALRASLRPLGERRRVASLPSLAPPAALGPLAWHTWTVADLDQRIGASRGPWIRLWHSYFFSRESPDLREPWPLYPLDALVETVKSTIDPEGWKREGASLCLEHESRLVARTDEAHARGIDALLATIRRTIRMHELTATVVSLPISALPSLWAASDDGEALAKARGAASLSSEGARLEGRVSLRCMDGERSAVFEGRSRHYVAAYETEIAEKAAIGKPRPQRALEGISFEVDAVPAAGGAALACELRWDRSTWRGQRSWPTRHGTIDLPTLGFESVDGALVVPVGGSRVASISSDGDRAVVVVLSVGDE